MSSNTNIHFKVSAGHHARNGCIIRVKLPDRFADVKDLGMGVFSLIDSEGNRIPLQIVREEGSFHAYWLVSSLPPGRERVYSLTKEESSRSNSGVELITKDNKIDIHVEGMYFTSYVYDTTFAKPFIGPVMGPFGDSVTRLDLDTKEHPHQRSIWVGIGDIGGFDFWGEPGMHGMYGRQIHQDFFEHLTGSVFGRLKSNVKWVDYKNKPVIDEVRTLTVFNTPANGRIMDIEIKFKASYGRVEFGATKEAGPLGVRVAESINANNGGFFTNSYGALLEAECWGRRAHWCDYYGQLNGHVVGISVFDGSENLQHPACWHIRNYGLMTPNNFYFLGGFILKPDEELDYSYRIYVHGGDTIKSCVSEKYNDFLNLPKVEILTG